MEAPDVQYIIKKVMLQDKSTAEVSGGAGGGKP